MEYLPKIRKVKKNKPYSPFTIVKHKVLAELDLTLEEYVLLDMTYHFKQLDLQKNSNPLKGIGVGEEVFDIIDTLIQKEYITHRCGLLELTERVRECFNYWGTTKGKSMQRIGSMFIKG